MSDRVPPARTALIVSPFASWPLDVGHRRRVAQSTALLRDAGYRVTFLLYAFESGWYWRRQLGDYNAMAAQWDEVLVVQANRTVGMPPREGGFHALDEWWSEELEVTLRNLFRQRHIDVMVVHNVWLSKALTLAPCATTTVLETHDLFWKRRALLDRIGIGHDFFEPEQASEIVGIDRAQFTIAIQERDSQELTPLVKSKLVTLPFYDPAMEDAAQQPPRAAYLHPEKVTFGFLGSAHTYNVTGMQAVLDALEDRVARSFAPVDLLLGGTADAKLKTRLPATRLGRVPSEAGFYGACDIALAPTFEGTGFKIKVADMLALGLPTLVARHSAIGTSLDGEAVADTPEEMAEAMVRIALTRPPLSGLRRLSERAREDLARRTETGTRSFFRLLHAIKPCLIVDLSGCGIEHGMMPLISYFALLRHLPPNAFTHVVLRAEVLALVEPVLPIGVCALLREEVAAFTACYPHRLLVDVDGASAAWFAPGADDRVLRDDRWAWVGQESATAAQDAPAFPLPLLHPDVSWDPCVEALRKAWRARPGSARMPEGTERILFLDWVGDAAPSPAATLRRNLWLVNMRDAAATEAALMALLDSPEQSLEIVWLGDERPVLRGIVIEAAASRRHRVSGLLDGCFLGPANTDAVLGDVNRRLGAAVTSILRATRASAA